MNIFLEYLKRQDEEELKAYYKSQSMKNEINYLSKLNPNREISQGNILNNINEMNKPLDLYDEYLRRGENIYYQC